MKYKCFFIGNPSLIQPKKMVYKVLLLMLLVYYTFSYQFLFAHCILYITVLSVLVWFSLQLLHFIYDVFSFSCAWNILFRWINIYILFFLHIHFLFIFCEIEILKLCIFVSFVTSSVVERFIFNTPGSIFCMNMYLSVYKNFFNI